MPISMLLALQGQLTRDEKAMVELLAGCFWNFILLVVILGLWKIFTKAGQPGWTSLVPVYNTIVVLEIIGRPTWWIILFLIPFANIVVSIMMMIDLARSFGKDMGYALGLIMLPFIFLPLLGFSSDEYLGPVN